MYFARVEVTVPVARDLINIKACGLTLPYAKDGLSGSTE
jgi:hypothetical protein